MRDKRRDETEPPTPLLSRCVCTFFWLCLPLGYTTSGTTGRRDMNGMMRLSMTRFPDYFTASRIPRTQTSTIHNPTSIFKFYGFFDDARLSISLYHPHFLCGYNLSLYLEIILATRQIINETQKLIIKTKLSLN